MNTTEEKMPEIGSNFSTAVEMPRLEKSSILRKIACKNVNYFRAQTYSIKGFYLYTYFICFGLKLCFLL